MRRIIRYIITLISCLLFTHSSLATEVLYVDTDAYGTPVVMTNAQGNKVWEGQHLPFGERYQDTASPEENNIGFIGKERDVETELSYFDARYYDDTMGRFITVDPIGPVDPWSSTTDYAYLVEPQRLSRYAYGLNNPYRFIDPDGKEGVLAIHSSGKGLIDGHSWISFKSDAQVETTTWGTWGNNPYGKGNGLHEGLEKGKTGDVSRRIHINDAEEKKLRNYVEKIRDKGEEGWSQYENCSYFASEAWNLATGEKLNPINSLGIPTPSALKGNILEKNDNKSHVNLDEKSTTNSSFP